MKVMIIQKTENERHRQPMLMKKPELNSCTAVLFVRSINESRDFYCNVLGLKIDLDFGKNVIFKNGLAIWEIRKDHIIPVKIGHQNLTGASTRFELYFETGDLDLIHESLVSHKVTFLHELHEEPWGQRTIRFFDPDGHLIEVGETMGDFIARFYLQGMTPSEISSRTSVPVEEVNRLLGII